MAVTMSQRPLTILHENLVIVVGALVLLRPLSTESRILASDGESQCQPIRVRACRNMPWNRTQLPNALGHETLSAVRRALEPFGPVLKSRCSRDLDFLLCALYTPQCSAGDAVLPCRQDCQKVRDACAGEFDSFGLPWPTELDCQNLPSYNRGRCVSTRSYEDYGLQEAVVGNEECRCERQKKLRKRLYMKKGFEYAIRATFKFDQRVLNGPLVLSVQVEEVLHQPEVSLRPGPQTLWVGSGCLCSRLLPGNEYLLLGYQDKENHRLLFDEYSMALRWKDAWREKIQKWERSLRKERAKNNRKSASRSKRGRRYRPEDRRSSSSSKSRRRSER